MMRRPTAAADSDRLRTIAAEGRVTELVVGLPLNSDGSVGPQATATLRWATEVAHALQLPITFVDERYSSQRAEASLGRAARGATVAHQAQPDVRPVALPSIKKRHA